MEMALYLLARVLIAVLQALPIGIVALLGRVGGMVTYVLDRRHRRVALKNLRLTYGAERPPAEIKALARENFRCIGEAYACAVKTAMMPQAQLEQRLEFIGAEKLAPHAAGNPPRSIVIAIGHFGNFELYAHLGPLAPGYELATTYRGLRQPSLNRLLTALRNRSGCTFYERRSEFGALKAALRRGGVALGLLADQHAGNHGVRLPFLGRECSVSAAPALFALRYDSPLHTAFCYRIGLARWRIEVGDEIPLRAGGEFRSVEAITRDVNQAFEVAVRRQPENWFWVHNRWKPAPTRAPKPAAELQP